MMILNQCFQRSNRTSFASTSNVNGCSHQLILLVTLLSLLLLPGITKAVVSLDIDGFNPVVNSPVLAISQQADGKVLIGGDFTSVNSTPRNYIARLNADGSLDTGFDPGEGANSRVRAISQQADGKVLIGGDFTSINGTPRNYIARLNADGSLDTEFDPGEVANASVFSISQQADGKVLIGGEFTRINGLPRNYIARLNADGSLDTGFDLGSGANGPVLAISQQADGKVLIGGDFTSVNSTPRNYIARLNADGSLDTGFDLGSGANNIVYAISQQADGKVLISGFFTRINGTPRNRIARLNADGSLDTGFDPGSGASGPVRAISQQADGKVLIGGDFTSINGTPRNRIARLNADGSLDTEFDPGEGAGGFVFAVSQQADGKVLIGGGFTNINGTERSRIARLNADGSLDTGFNPGSGANTIVNAISQQADGKVLIGGFFTSINGTPRNYIARLNADGSLDTGFNPGIEDNIVNAVSQQADGKVLIGGDFTRINGTTRNLIARLNADGSLDTGFDPGTGANASVFSISQQADGKVLIGGVFTRINGTPRNRIARLNADGSLDTGFDPGSGASGPVRAISQQA
ncbi:MAG: putative delta-60 repeat protein, partial [Arenicella sp.]